MVNVNELTLTSLERIIGYNLGGEYLWTLDELQNATISNTQEKVDITGKQGRKLNSLKRNKAVKVTGTNGMLSLGLIATDTGTEVARDENVQYKWYEIVDIEENAASTTYTAVGTVGAEIDALYIVNVDGTRGVKLEQDATATEGTFTYTPGTKKLAFLADAYNGQKAVVYYTRKVNAAVISNDSGKYSQKCTLYIDALAEDKCNKCFLVQFVIPVADFSGNFDIAMGDNQATHSFEADSLSSGCSGGGIRLWDMLVIEDGTADVT